MQKKIPFIVFIASIVLLFFSFTNPDQNVTEEIIIAIRSGNSRELSKHFNNNINLTVPGYEGVYSKAQSEIILKEFFSKFTPKSFNIIHQGVSKDGSQYSIGNLETTNNTMFRSYFLLKKHSDRFFLQQLRFESDN